MRTYDVNPRRQMALPTPANQVDEAGSVFPQSAIENREERSNDSNNTDGSYVNGGFVYDVVVDIGQERISAVPVVRQRDIPRADLCFSRRYLGPRVPLVREGVARVYRPRRLWFERRHWGSDAPDCSVQFPRRVELGQGIAESSLPKESSEDSSSRVVYNIGVFYSDTDLCSGSSASEDEKSSASEKEKSSASETEKSSACKKGDEKSSASEKVDEKSSASKIIKSSEIRESSARTGDGDKSFTDTTIAETSDDLLREGSSAHPGGKTYENVRGPRLLPAHNKQVVVRPQNMTGPSGGADPPTRRSNNRSTSRRLTTPHTQLTPDTFTPDAPTTPTPQLPDILNSHLPPPYSTLPPTTPNNSNGRRLPPPSHPPPPPPPPPPAQQSGAPGSCPGRPFRTQRGARRGRSRGGVPSSFVPQAAASESDEPKHCCGVRVTQTVSIRWFIVMIAFVGLCCAVVGTVLGALKATGREHLTVSLLMIGVGIVLITVSGIAWRLTSHDAPSCRAMLGLQNSEHEPNRRFVPRVPPYGRPTHHPYAAMMYPEFQYRPPPPSYQASMQEYRLRLLLLDRHSTSATSPSALSPVSPPPTYRSAHNATTATTPHSRPSLTLTEREYSRPPSYRSRASSAGLLRPSTETLCSLTPPTSTTQQQQQQLQQQQQQTSHSRNPSLSLSFLSHESLFLDSGHSRPQPSFTSPSGDSVVGGLSEEGGGTSPPSWTMGPASWKHRNDVNAVTIVQTTDSSQVLNRDSVILSVPGNDVRAAGEVRILAHV